MKRLLRATIRLPLALCLLGLTLPLPACDDGPASPPAPTGWRLDPSGPAPEWLAETGLFADVAGLVPADGVIAFHPPHALWSGGADKARLIALPPGGRIRTDGPVWQFPEGTVLAKHFSYPDIEGRAGDVLVETRLEWRTAQGWRYAEYHWNAEGTAARRYPDRWADVPLALLPNVPGADPFVHTLPSELGCDGCHGAPGNTAVLGITANNLPPELVAAGVFDPPVTPTELPARTPEEAAAMSYLVANCTHCHHGRRGVAENASYSLLPADLVANTVGQPTDSSASGDGTRIVPGDPAGSALYQAVVHARDADYAGQLKPMPPLGIDRVDPRAEAVLRAWIEGLEPLEDLP